MVPDEGIDVTVLTAPAEFLGVSRAAATVSRTDRPRRVRRILGDGTGIDILREIKARGLSCPVIMITGDPGVETAADSIRLGAFDYIPKPVNQESLLHATRTALK